MHSTTAGFSLSTWRMTTMRCLVAAVAGTLATTAIAQGYPSKSTRIVVPFPPGGPVDIAGRLIAQKLAESSGQTVLVDNRAGAGTIIGTEIVAKSNPDGHTLLIGTSQIVVNPFVYAKLPYNTATDLLPVTQISSQPYMLTSHPSLPAKTFKDVIALAKAKPGALHCASAGIGSGNHLTCELLNKMAGTQIAHVPYKGSIAALNDLVGGQVEMAFSNAMAAVPFVKAGKLQPLAITSKQRAKMLPDLPTVAESGFPGFEASVWFGVFVAGGTPRPLVQIIAQEVGRVLKNPDVSKVFTSEGGEIVASSPQQFAEYVKSELTKWSEVVKFADIKAE